VKREQFHTLKILKALQLQNGHLKEQLAGLLEHLTRQQSRVRSLELELGLLEVYLQTMEIGIVNSAFYVSSSQNSSSELAYLVSPTFDFSSTTTYAIFSAYVRYKMEKSTTAFDGTNFQYSINGGGTWTTIGARSDTLNWYSDTVTVLSSGPGKQEIKRISSFLVGFISNVRKSLGRNFSK
jgi:hypothetical protein